MVSADSIFLTPSASLCELHRVLPSSRRASASLKCLLVLCASSALSNWVPRAVQRCVRSAATCTVLAGLAGFVGVVAVVLAASARGAPRNIAAAVATISFLIGVSFGFDIDRAFSRRLVYALEGVGVDVN